MQVRWLVVAVVIGLTFSGSYADDFLIVKPGKQAIVKERPEGDAERFPDRLAENTVVRQLSSVPRYYEIELDDGRRGWSWKGYYLPAEDPGGWNVTPVADGNLLSRSDVLKISVIDVEVGDATLIICPVEEEHQDVLLIDTGENDADRILNELEAHGFETEGNPFTRLYITHYDFDHFGGAPEVIPLADVVYDRGDDEMKHTGRTLNYLNALDQPGVERETMDLDYSETFSGGVRVECVAVNNRTDFDTVQVTTSDDENTNSIALIVSFGEFEFFVAGDLTGKSKADPERRLATGISPCDVYHVNHHGSRATSSHQSFVEALEPQVAIASNGTKHGHPSDDVAQRLLVLGCIHYQTNINLDPRAHQPAARYVADTTYNEADDGLEEEEGALGTIRLVVDAEAGKYYVFTPHTPVPGFDEYDIR